MTTVGRKLATIVALDAAGFSRQSEIDESAALKAIAGLRERVHASAAAHGGRVFNTAGDGFMLEFPTVSGAVSSAEELLGASRVPLRIGVHVGEVAEAPGGDLLGRGVNVAARLQQMASAGELIVSGDVKRALGSPIAERLKPRGVAKLDKMDERIEIFALESAWQTSPRLPRVGRRTVLAMIAAVVVLAIIVGAAVAPGLFSERSERVAVLHFQTIGGAPADFAPALADQIVSVMSLSDLQSVPIASGEQFRGEDRREAARQAGVGFILDGAVREESGDVRVSMHVIDARENTTLWSNTYRRRADAASYLQEQVAAHAASVLRCALISRRPRAGETDAQTLSIFLRACDRAGHFDRNAEEMLAAARQVTERAPRFSRGWSLLAMASAFASRSAPPARAEELRDLTRSAAARARALDSRNAEAYLAEAAMLPPVGAWRERQELIDRALRLGPNSPDSLILQGELLAELGRMQEALIYFRRAAALEPLSPSYLSILLAGLTSTGNFEEAEQLRQRLDRVWPDSASGWYNRFTSRMLIGDPNAALAMLDDENAPVTMEASFAAALRRYILARRDNNPAAQRAAADEIAEYARRNGVELPRTVVMASMVGNLDEAFELARQHFSTRPTELSIEQPIGGAGRYFIFMPSSRAMRHDIRFIALARDIGLTDYWLETGRWPDFCSDPDLPYDCRAEAARLS